MSSESKAPDFEPPAASVARIIKNVLPDNIQVTKDARMAFTRAAGIFIFYLTNCANEHTREGKRLTITTADVMDALKELDFEDFEQPLNEFLAKYRLEVAEAKKHTKSKKGSNAEVDLEDDEGGEGGEGVELEHDSEHAQEMDRGETEGNNVSKLSSSPFSSGAADPPEPQEDGDQSESEDDSMEPEQDDDA